MNLDYTLNDILAFKDQLIFFLGSSGTGKPFLLSTHLLQQFISDFFIRKNNLLPQSIATSSD